MRWPVVGMLLGLGLGGCTAGSLDPAFQKAQEGWREVGLPAPQEKCFTDGEVRETQSPEEYAALCRTSDPSMPPCLAYEDGTWIAVLPPGMKMHRPEDDPGEPAIHEALHALHWCALRVVGRVVDNGYDYGHEDPRIWKAVGGENSAQSHAQRLYEQWRASEHVDGTQQGTKAP